MKSNRAPTQTILCHSNLKYEKSDFKKNGTLNAIKIMARELCTKLEDRDMGGNFPEQAFFYNLSRIQFSSQKLIQEILPPRREAKI